MKLFTRLPPVTPPMVAKASTKRAKYSAGPKRMANCTNKGANSASPRVATPAPTKEATAESPSASPPRPCRAIG